jgi:hypothetical protein
VAVRCSALTGTWLVTHWTKVTLGLLSAVAVSGRAQAVQQPVPHVRPLGPIVAATRDPIGNVAQVRVLSDGGLLVHDVARRRVLLFDNSLASSRSIIDTTGATKEAYGNSNAALFPYAGDSSLFLDYASGAILVLDPSGVIVRILAAPTNPFMPRFGSLFLTNPGVAFDRQGHFIFLQTVAHARHDVNGMLDGSTIVPDTTPLVRIGLLTRREDTLAALKRSSMFSSAGRLLANPLPEADAWAVLSDGTVAIVRAHDYHIDWVAPDGTVTSSPQIAHEWTRFTDSMKAAFVDSARVSDSLRARARVDSQGGIDAMVKARRATPSVGQRLSTDSQAAASIRAALFPSFAPAWTLPDYLPPFSSISTPGDPPVSADADNELWVRVSGPGEGGGDRVYDVVNRQGVLVDRVRLPGATSIVGFGPGVVYLAAREGSGMQVARARIR